MHVWVQIGSWAHHSLARCSARPPSVPQNKATQRRYSLKQRKLFIILPRLISGYLKEEAPSPPVSSCDMAACHPGQKKVPIMKGVGQLLPEGWGSHSHQDRAHPAVQGDKVDLRPGQARPANQLSTWVTDQQSMARQGHS